MARTSIRNKFILSFLGLIFIVVMVVGLVNRLTDDFFLSQAISTALAMVAGFCFGSFLARSLVGRIHILSRSARRISQGDLAGEIAVRSRDEFRDLEEVFGVMVQDLRVMLSELRNVSVQIRDTNRRLGDLTARMLGDSRQMDAFAQTIAQGSEEQTAIIRATSARVATGLAVMQQILDQSAKTSRKIGETRHKSEMGSSQARETLNHLAEVLRQTGDHIRPLVQLTQKVERIRMVVKVLDGIAEKTDILALNASLEATRAGEAGKGFGLVAHEIRSMAENSKDSSREIATLVTDILADGQGLAQSLGRTQEEIGRGTGIISEIGETFGAMLAGVQVISDEVQGMAEGTTHIVGELQPILEHVRDLTHLAQENLEATRQTSNAIRQQTRDMEQIDAEMTALKGLSARMQATQQRFRLAAGAAED